jgi:hypothetical protein
MEGIMKKIYITHCSKTKDDSLENTGLAVLPEELYQSKVIQRFIKRCKKQKVDWAIFSDLYGVWFSGEKHEWYEKDPSKVSDEEFQKLVTDFDRKLEMYDEIYFYHNPGRFHSLYKRLIKESALRNRIKMISHLSDIK